MVYKIEVTEEALAMLAEITDRRVRTKLLERIRRLAKEPAQQGKPMVDELAGCRSVRAVGQRYRIIYEILDGQVTVLVVGVGIRKEGHRLDVYNRTTKLIRTK
jgi:mRNA interferase RelE/StbE